RRLGYPVLELSARAAEGASGSTSGCAPEGASENVQGRASAESLRPFLHGQTSVLVGQSGMGKSTLLNALIPEANAATREISAALDTGKHTTTHARLHRLDAGSALIDSPGLQSFGLHHLDIAALEAAFPEFQPLLGHCRFRDCRHDREPGCAFTAALARGDIAPRRFACYRTLRGESAGKA
ncbi:MAG: ribosome small subunit-dependent GTPase A, partial [Azospira sp.]|nr:ribosome small subunit-dependent GTPase A [Azospira sp.]